MTQAAKAQEPSMEEILASIRRIIADDDAPAAPKAPAKADAKPVAPVPVAPAAVPDMNAELDQSSIDAMLASVDALAAVQSEPTPEPVAEPEPEEEVFDLTESMAAEAPAFQAIDGHGDLEFAEQEEFAAAPEPEPTPQLPPVAAPRAATPESALLSQSTAAAVDSAFNTLAQTVLIQNARTLEDLVREMLRPLLKSWLDDNLPQMVERMVRAEIERVARGR